MPDAGQKLVGEPMRIITGSVYADGDGPEMELGITFDSNGPEGLPVIGGVVPAAFALATECPAYEVDDECVVLSGPKPMGGYESGSHYIAHGRRCDCNWWWVMRPVTTPPEVDALAARLRVAAEWVYGDPEERPAASVGEMNAAIATAADLLVDQAAEIRRHHDDFERWEEMAAKGARQVAAIEAVRALHIRTEQDREGNGYDVSYRCSECWEPWPCDTMKALGECRE